MTGHDDLEQRLPGYLANRAPTPPSGLLEALLRQTEELPQRHRVFSFATAGWLGLGVAAAAAILVTVVVFGPGLVQFPVAPGTHATPTASTAPSMTTMVVPVRVKEKAIAEQAELVFDARLKALGIGTFTASIGDDMRFSFVLPPSVDPADVDAVLHTVGVVEWLAWPDGLPTPNVGDPVPDGVLPLFDAESQIRSVTVTSTPNPDRPAGVQVTFGPAATQALSTYTTMHVNQPMPLALDGKIVTVPTILTPITEGDLFITAGASASEPGSLSAAALGAILKSGPLPPGWTMP